MLSIYLVWHNGAWELWVCFMQNIFTVQLLFYYYGLVANMFSISDIYKDNSSMLETRGVVACLNHNRLVPFLCTVPKQFG